MRVPKSIILGILAGLLLRDMLPARGAAVPAPEPDVRRDATVVAIDKALPSVVNVATETIVESSDPEMDFWRRFFNPYNQQLPPQAQRSIGSGVIIHEDGYILTNNHVVSRATHVWVKLADGRVYEAERLVGTTISDVALLRIIRKGTEKFTPIKFAGDDDLLLGETVVALGNPFGLGGSVSRGILSSKERVTPRAGEKLDISNWLQTDAAINPGNSGGPLINLRGELIGISVATYREAQGIGFAIPVKRVSETMTEFFTPEAAKGMWLGMRMAATGPTMRVLAVQPGSPADNAGVHEQDVVRELNGKPVTSVIDFTTEIIQMKDKRDISVVVQRGATQKKFDILMIPEKEFFNQALIQRKLGAALQPLTPELAETMGLSFYGGLAVSGVEKKGPADAVGLAPGMAVQAVDGLMPQGLVQLAKYLYNRQPGEKVNLDVIVESRTQNSISRRQAKVEVAVR